MLKKSLVENPKQECRLIRGGLHNEEFIEVFLCQADETGMDLRFLTTAYVYDRVGLQDFMGDFYYDSVSEQLLELGNGRIIAEIIMDIENDDSLYCEFKNGNNLDLRPSNLKVSKVEV